MEVKEFFYHLPPELIAQEPAGNRDESRLLTLDRATGKTAHRRFSDITGYLSPGDCLVLNDTRVIPARIFGRTERGGAVEFLLLKRLMDDRWEVLVKPGKRAVPGAKLSFGDGLLLAEVLVVNEKSGSRTVRFSSEGGLLPILEKIGRTPLPPYIKKELADRERYQTVYSKNPGSAAAPTAGLHFTPGLLESIREKGAEIVFLTLHVGIGTFRPVREKNVEDHVMHSEYCCLSADSAQRINKARTAGKRVFAVGTTACRTLESAADESGVLSPFDGETDIFIYPGYKFRAVDALVTNFHLPESTLLMLVSAFAGKERVMAAYGEAIRERYRFFSFGDAMLIG